MVPQSEVKGKANQGKKTSVLVGCLRGFNIREIVLFKTTDGGIQVVGRASKSETQAEGDVKVEYGEGASPGEMIEVVGAEGQS